MNNQQSHINQNNILEKFVDVLCIFNNEGKFLYATKSSERLWGYKPEELLKKPYMSLVSNADHRITKEAADRVMSGFELKNFVNTYIHRSGEAVPVSWSARYDSSDQKMYCIARDISDMDVQNVERVRRSEERFRTLIKNSTDGLALLNKTGEILKVSDPGKKILNICLEGGRENLRKNVHEEDILKIDEALSGIIKEPRESQKIEYRIQIYNEYRWIEAIFQNQYDEPTIRAIVLNFSDITDRKRSEIIIAKSEQLRKNIMNAALDAIICIDREGKIIIWNQQAEKTFGWKREEMLGKPMVDHIIPHEYRERHTIGFNQYLKTGKGSILNKRMEITALNRDQKIIPVELLIVPVEMDHSTVFCAFIRDITERKEVENLLKKSEERYHKMVEEVNDYAILLLNNDGTIENWNRGAEQIKGYKEEEIVGKNFSIFYTEEERKKNLPENFLKEAAENGSASTDGWRVRKDGSRFWANIVLTALHDDAENVIGFTNVTRDLTAKKKAEDKLIKYTHELESSNQELEQFAYIASHDLQEPLRMVTSFLTQLEKKYKDQLDERAQKYIYFATDGAARMRRIILDLLEYSRVGRKEYEIEELDVNEAMEEVVKFHRVAIKEKNAEIIWEDLPVIHAARTPVEQVLQNLIANAIKYQHPNVEPKVVIKCKEKTRFWEFSVTDNGIGIEPQYFDKIFVLFQRLHQREQYSGTGIGLAIVKKIIENFNGKIWIESEQGKGSTFYFTIPKYPSSELF